MFAELFVAYFVAHHVADYWVQSECQAIHKGERGTWRGRLACANHVLGHVITTGLLLVMMTAILGYGPSILGGLIGVGIISVSHYLIDRRFTLRWVATQVGRLIPGKLGYYDNGGAPHLDQSAHMLFLFLGALASATL